MTLSATLEAALIGQATKQDVIKAIDEELMRQDILDFIEEYQSGKSGIYPYHVALEVCARFNVPLDTAIKHVSEHIGAVLSQVDFT